MLLPNLHAGIDDYIGIDPGNTCSGVVTLRTREGQVVDVDAHARYSNAELADALRNWIDPAIVYVEYMVPRGMPTAAEEMDTMFELGRLVEAWGGLFVKVPRHIVKIHLCGSMKAKDGNIRQAAIDLFGGDNVAIGNKKCPACKGKKATGRGKERVPCEECDATGYLHPPGLLHGVSSHAWQALGVVLTGLGAQATA